MFRHGCGCHVRWIPVGPARWAGDALARRRQAEMRAEALLLSRLPPSQSEQCRSHGWFDVVTPGGNLYRVWPWKVTRLDASRESGRHCDDETTLGSSSSRRAASAIRNLD